MSLCDLFRTLGRLGHGSSLPGPWPRRRGPFRLRASAHPGRTSHHFPQMVAPGGLDVAEAGVEGVFESDRGAAGEEAVDEALAGLGAALVLEQVEDRAAEDHRVAAARW